MISNIIALKLRIELNVFMSDTFTPLRRVKF